MKLKLNKDTYNIKTANLLTCKEYIELSKKENSNVIDYISVTTNKTFKDIADLKFDTFTINRLNAYVQQIKNVYHLDRSYLFCYYKNNNQIVSEKTFNFESIGTVFLMQTRAEKTTNELELMIYLLAIAIDSNYSSENIDNIYNELLDYNYIEVFSFICFFFGKFVNGLYKKNKSLRMLITMFITKIHRKLKS